MRILVVCVRSEKERIRQILVKTNVAAHANILFAYSFDGAKSFIERHLVQEGCHLDLLIVSGTIELDAGSVHLVDWLRNAETSYSRKTFKVASLPIIFYGREIRYSDYYEYGYNARVRMNLNDRHDQLVQSTRSVVKGFREGLWEDLDLLRLNFDELQGGFLASLDPYYLIRIKSDPAYWASRTMILCEEFIRTPHPLDYPWLQDDTQAMEFDIEDYEGVLRDIKRYNRAQSEKTVFHRLYNRAPWLLQLDLFCKPIYEAQLMKNSREFEEPDYILPSGAPGLIPNNITEVKLPTLALLHKRRRKPGLKSGASDALIQLGDYRRHLRKKAGKEQLAELVKNSGPVNYTLLASNDDERYTNEKRLKDILEDHYAGLRLVTHHEKLEEAVRYYERKKWLA